MSPQSRKDCALAQKVVAFPARHQVGFLFSVSQGLILCHGYLDGNFLVCIKCLWIPTAAQVVGPKACPETCGLSALGFSGSVCYLLENGFENETSAPVCLGGVQINVDK